MSAVEWTDAEREALTEHELTADTREDTYGREIERVGCLCGAWEWDANDSECAARWWDHVLDATLAQLVAERERAAVQDFLEKRDRPVIKVETAGEAKFIVDALTAEVERLRATVVRVEALLDAAVDNGYPARKVLTAVVRAALAGGESS